jgi:hypothetical protein
LGVGPTSLFMWLVIIWWEMRLLFYMLVARVGIGHRTFSISGYCTKN